jgi:hypothetical protein
MTGDTLQSKFKKLESTGGADLALAELKAKMGLGPATEGGQKQLGQGEKPADKPAAGGLPAKGHERGEE